MKKSILFLMCAVLFTGPTHSHAHGISTTLPKARKALPTITAIASTALCVYAHFKHKNLKDKERALKRAMLLALDNQSDTILTPEETYKELEKIFRKQGAWKATFWATLTFAALSTIFAGLAHYQPEQTVQPPKKNPLHPTAHTAQTNNDTTPPPAPPRGKGETRATRKKKKSTKNTSNPRASEREKVQENRSGTKTKKPGTISKVFGRKKKNSTAESAQEKTPKKRVQKNVKGGTGKTPPPTPRRKNKKSSSEKKETHDDTASITTEHSLGSSLATSDRVQVAKTATPHRRSNWSTRLGKGVLNRLGLRKKGETKVDHESQGDDHSVRSSSTRSSSNDSSSSSQTSSSRQGDVETCSQSSRSTIQSFKKSIRKFAGLGAAAKRT